MSAIATVHRLLDIGAEGYMIAAAVHGIVAQRLVRRVCENCVQPTAPDAREIAWIRARSAANLEGVQFARGVGCTYCNQTGYRGRIAVYELLEIDRVLADSIRRGDLREFDEMARSRPEYVSLATSAYELAREGFTTVAEAIGVDSSLDEAGNSEVREPTLLEEALAEIAADGAGTHAGTG